MVEGLGFRDPNPGYRHKSQFFHTEESLNQHPAFREAMTGGPQLVWIRDKVQRQQV